MPVVLVTELNKQAFYTYLPPVMRERLEQSETVALGAVEDDGTAAGALVCAVSGDWLELLWLYVGARYRGRDWGRVLIMRALGVVGAQGGMTGMFAEFGGDEVASYAQQALTPIGFYLQPEEGACTAYKLELRDLERSGFWKLQVDTRMVNPLSDMSDIALREFGAELALWPEGLAIELPIKWRSYDQSLSTAFVRDGRVRGILLIERGQDITIAYAHAMPGESGAMPAMLRAAGEAALKFLPGETPITLGTVSAASTSLVERLFPDIERLPARRVEYVFQRTFELEEVAIYE